MDTQSLMKVIARVIAAFYNYFALWPRTTCFTEAPDWLCAVAVPGTSRDSNLGHCSNVQH